MASYEIIHACSFSSNLGEGLVARQGEYVYNPFDKFYIKKWSNQNQLQRMKDWVEIEQVVVGVGGGNLSDTYEGGFTQQLTASD